MPSEILSTLVQLWSRVQLPHEVELIIGMRKFMVLIMDSHALTLVFKASTRQISFGSLTTNFGE